MLIFHTASDLAGCFLYFGQKESIKVQVFSSAQVKIPQIPHANFETTSQFLSKFCIIFFVVIHNPL